MRLLLVPILALVTPIAAASQSLPNPSLDDPRLQTIVYDAARPARMIAFPDATLTVMLVPGDQIERVTLSDQNAFDVRVTGANDSLNILASRPNGSATLIVDTKQRRYEFDVTTSGGLAAYLVRYLAQAAPPMPPPPMLPFPQAMPAPPPTSSPNQYRLTGERVLLPKAMSDDGQRTYIEWAEGQSLPAVFGIGPTGQEEVVDGFMRGGRYTIDRVYRDLIFRIDKKLAKARRLTERKPG